MTDTMEKRAYKFAQWCKHNPVFSMELTLEQQLEMFAKQEVERVLKEREEKSPKDYVHLMEDGD